MTQENQEDNLVAVENIGHFAALVEHWHSNRVARIQHLAQMPEGTKATLEENGVVEDIVLEGAILKAFKLGLESALNEIKELPFGVEMEDANNPETESTPQPEGS